MAYDIATGSERLLFTSAILSKYMLLATPKLGARTGTAPDQRLLALTSICGAVEVFKGEFVQPITDKITENKIIIRMKYPFIMVCLIY